MSKHRIEYRQRCKSCGGSGLFCGMAELAGSAVVCRTCKGEGFEDVVHTYDEFEGRMWPPAGITRVYATNPGIVVDGQGTVPGGVPLMMWLADPDSVRESGREMRERTCPAWWYQGADYEKRPDWNDDDRKCGWGMFSQCDFFSDKAGCWERWDREAATSRGAAR